MVVLRGSKEGILSTGLHNRALKNYEDTSLGTFLPCGRIERYAHVPLKVNWVTQCLYHELGTSSTWSSEQPVIGCAAASRLRDNRSNNLRPRHELSCRPELMPPNGMSVWSLEDGGYLARCGWRQIYRTRFALLEYPRSYYTSFHWTT